MRARSVIRFSLLATAALASTIYSQTTQSLIGGRIVDSRTGRPVRAAQVNYFGVFQTASGIATADESGRFYLPLLSPGLYRLRVSADRYQAQEVQQLELTVAAKIEIEFRLRPLNDVWEAGQFGSVFLPGNRLVLNFAGPDLDSTRTEAFESRNGRLEPLESSLSQVFDTALIRALPLQSRDVYTTLVTQPGVTSDAATGRGLGLSINGQRPTASNFLQDGLENNNYLITGPLTTVAPEAIDEYRVSTNNFSAEYGRTAGFLANALTVTGSDRVHGLGYGYFKNEALNANSFQENRFGAKRVADHESQPGFVVGGPVLKNRLFFSSSYEYLRSRSQSDPETFLLPTPSLAADLGAGSLIGGLLAKYPAPIGASVHPVSQVTVSPPVSLNRHLALERLDLVSRSGKDRFFARGNAVGLERPDFVWTPYRDFITPLVQDTSAVAGSYTRTFGSGLINEARAGYVHDDLHFNRAHPEVPTLVAQQFTDNGQILLPGSPAFYSFSNRSGTTELLDNLISSRSRHQVTLGGGVLIRRIGGYLTAGQDGAFFFGEQGVTSGLIALFHDAPSFASIAVDRFSATTAPVSPDSNRHYRYEQFDLFAQDVWKVFPRFTINYGVRYENFGAPVSDGIVKDALVVLGSGSILQNQLVGSSLPAPGRTDTPVFGVDDANAAYRIGAAYDLLGNGRTLLRVGSGIYYDRPFDNLWANVRNNSFLLPTVFLAAPINYLAPAATVLASLPKGQLQSNFPNLTLIDPGLRNGRVYSYFAGVQHRAANGLTLEVNAQGSYGRNLVTTDIVNRLGSTSSGARLNPSLPDISYRAAQGYSDYNALTAVARYRYAQGMVQASYTWSHTIDNQSDPIAGDFFDLSFTGLAGTPATPALASFSRQFDPDADRGNSDFDQRQNLVLFGYWSTAALHGERAIHRLLRNWTVSGIAAFRSGFPFTVIQSSAADASGNLINPRPDVVNSNTELQSREAVAGGVRLLDPAAFASVQGRLGNEGRNALHGPGLYSLDLSLGREFPLSRVREGARFTLRADAFNLLNHANLNNPDPLLVDNLDFGVATYGRIGRGSGFPAVAPLNETPRQIQILLRLEF